MMPKDAEREGADAHLVCSGCVPDQGRNEGKKLTGNFRVRAKLERENYQLRQEKRIIRVKKLS